MHGHCQRFVGGPLGLREPDVSTEPRKPVHRRLHGHLTGNSSGLSCARKRVTVGSTVPRHPHHISLICVSWAVNRCQNTGKPLVEQGRMRSALYRSVWQGLGLALFEYEKPAPLAQGV